MRRALSQLADLALALAVVGLFGKSARAVEERSQELAIRAAVGASPGRARPADHQKEPDGDLCRSHPGKDDGRRSVVGLAGLLYGVSSYDPLTVVVVAIVVQAALTAPVVSCSQGRPDRPVDRPAAE